MTTLQISADDVDSLTTDGRIVRIRDIRPADLTELLTLHDRVSDRSMYLRYFGLNRDAAQHYIAQLADSAVGRRRSLGVFAHGTLLGVGVFERIDEASAEFAVLVADDAQHEGIGTLLLEHLIAEARALGIVRFMGEVLATNAPMIEVIRDLGFAPVTRTESGEVHVEFALDVDDRVVAAIAAREQSANLASLRPLLAPRSVAVVGAGQRPGSAGHEVLHNILDAGFTGNVYVVNPNRPNVQGLPCVPTAAELPEAPDLAVIALPAGQVLDAVRACGERGGRSAILLGSGFGESGADGVQLQDAVLRAARDYGMRLVGPNCIGVLNTDPTVRLDATFARLSRRPGNVAVLAQSGAFGIAVLHAMDEFGLGVSQFVSVGNKADVGGNDLLLAWERDSHTDVIAMYLESVGDPRRFARIAGQVARRKPILAIKSGRTEVGRRAGRSHTAAAASSDVAIDALFRRSGVLRMQSMGELVDTARLLAGQPLPTGPRVAIVGNSGGPEILAADAASDAGLVITEFGDTTRTTLRTLGAPDQNPLDLGAAAGDRLVARVMTTVLASPDVDAVLTVFTEVAISDAEAISRAITQAAAEAAKPVLSVAVGEHGAMHPVPGTAHAVPVYTFPEQAAAALGTAYRYSRIRTASMSLPDRPDGIDREAARAVVRTALLDGREWLTAREAYRLLVAYALPMCPQEIVTGVGSAAAAAVRLGYPVAAKLAEPGLHKSDVGGVRLGIADETALRTAVDQLRAVSANANPQVLLQPMITGGTELIVGAVHDPQCGPLVMLGAGGVLTDVLGDRAFALAPLADADADDLIDSLRSSRLLDGYRGAPRVSRGAVRDVLVRVAALVDDVPQIAELDLNPLVCTADGVHTIDARIRVAPPPHHPDPLVRQIRGPVRPKA